MSLFLLIFHWAAQKVPAFIENRNICFDALNFDALNFDALNFDALNFDASNFYA